MTWFGLIPALAQTKLQRSQIIRDYDLPLLQSKSSRYLNDLKTQRLRSVQYLRARQLPLKVRNRNGTLSHFSRVDEKGNLIYLKPYNNVDAAKSIGVDKLYVQGGLGLDLSGEDMVIGLWDAGRVRRTHELLSGKVTQKDNAKEFDDHSTQVAGTLVGKKLNTTVGALAQGMAYNANLEAYDWDDDIEEMYEAAASGLLISNHSYGPDLEQVRNPKNLLGAYDQISAAIDNLMYSAPYYLVVNAAGNDRDAYERFNPADGGYNLLAGEISTSKNALVIAAVYNVSNYTGPASVKMSEFSSWGPTNDNRIKPDISADGMHILSSVATTISGRLADNQYDYYSGTSAASPSAAGAILLLQELNAKLYNGQFLKSATIKALVSNTAKPAGDAEGPDPRFGWGLLDVEAAAKLILDNDQRRNGFYEELMLREKTSYSREIMASEDGNIKVTIAWNDPPAESQRAGEKNPVLFNDLDLRVKDEKGNTYFPWRLNPDIFSGPALNDGDNTVDNIEQVLIKDAEEGTVYRLEITHKNSLKEEKQEFSLVVSGATQHTAADLKKNLFIVYPNPGSEIIYIDFDAPYEEFDILVFDLLGRQILEKQHRGTPKASEAINVSGLAPGNYFLRVRTNSGKATEQIIVR